MKHRGMDLAGAYPEDSMHLCLESLRAIRGEAENLRTHEERATHKEQFNEQLRSMMTETRDPDFHRMAHEVIAGRMSRFTLYAEPSFLRLVEARHDRFVSEAAAMGMDVLAATRTALADDGHHELLELMDHFDAD